MSRDKGHIPQVEFKLQNGVDFFAAPTDALDSPKPDSYRGWTITWDYGHFTATGPDYDASWEGEEDGWVDNGHRVSARTREELTSEVDAWFEEHPAPTDAPIDVRTCPDCIGAGDDGHGHTCYTCDGQGGVVPFYHTAPTDALDPIPSSERELLTQACALYDDALDMMFDGPDESDEGYAKARWREARELLRKYLASTTREPALDLHTLEEARLRVAIKDGLDGWIGITDLVGATDSILTAIRALAQKGEA